MVQFFRNVWRRITWLKVPTEGKRTVVYILGALNFILFGVGTLILGITNDTLEDVFIGALQLAVPIVGWIWSIVWGVMIIYTKSQQQTDESRV